MGLDNDGWQENVLAVQPDGGATDWWGGRNQWLWQATPDFEVLAKVELSRAEGDTGYYQNLPSFPDAAHNGDSKVLPSDMVNPFFPTCAGCDFLGFREDQVGAGSPFDDRVVADLPHGLDANEVLNATLRLKWDLEAAELTSISGFLSVDKHNFEDCYNGVDNVCVADYNYNQDEFTQELRLAGGTDRLQWTTGLDCGDQDADNKQWGAFDYAGGAGIHGDSGRAVRGGFAVGLEDRGVGRLRTSGICALVAGVERDRGPPLLAGREDLRGGRQELHRRQQQLGPLRTGSCVRRISCPTRPFRSSGASTSHETARHSPSTWTVTASARHSVDPAGGLVDQDFDDVNAKLELDWRPIEIFCSTRRFPGARSPAATTTASSVVWRSARATPPFRSTRKCSMPLKWGSSRRSGLGLARLNGATFYYDYNDHQAVKFVRYRSHHRQQRCHLIRR